MFISYFQTHCRQPRSCYSKPFTDLIRNNVNRLLAQWRQCKNPSLCVFIFGEIFVYIVSNSLCRWAKFCFGVNWYQSLQVSASPGSSSLTTKLRITKWKGKGGWGPQDGEHCTERPFSFLHSVLLSFPGIHIPELFHGQNLALKGLRCPIKQSPVVNNS